MSPAPYSGRHTRTICRRLLMAITSVLITTAAHAQVEADVKACADLKGDPAIQACTRAIDSKSSKVNMATLYFNRGVEWGLQGKYDNAIVDYSAVLKLNPKHREAYNNRGNAYKRKGKYDEAVADYSEAIKLDPANAQIGRAHV